VNVLKQPCLKKENSEKKRKTIETGSKNLKDVREAKIKTKKLAGFLGEGITRPQASLIPCSQTQIISTRGKVI